MRATKTIQKQYRNNTETIQKQYRNNTKTTCTHRERPAFVDKFANTDKERRALAAGEEAAGEAAAASSREALGLRDDSDFAVK